MADYFARVAVRADYLLAVSAFENPHVGPVVEIRNYENLPGATIVACSNAQVAIIHDDAAHVEGPPLLWWVPRAELAALLKRKLAKIDRDQVWVCMSLPEHDDPALVSIVLATVEYPNSPFDIYGRRTKRFPLDHVVSVSRLQARGHDWFDWRGFAMQYKGVGPVEQTSWASGALCAQLARFLAALGAERTWLGLQATESRSVMRVVFRDHPEAIIFAMTLQNPDHHLHGDIPSWLEQIV